MKPIVISDMTYDYDGIMELRAKMIEYRNECLMREEMEKSVTLSHAIALLGVMAQREKNDTK